MVRRNDDMVTGMASVVIGHVPPAVLALLWKSLPPRAMDSCNAFSEPLASLSQRLKRAGALLRTQTELVIQRQNRDLLQSMDERTKHQLRLQQTVELLLIAAVAYYAVGLVGYIVVSLLIDK